MLGGMPGLNAGGCVSGRRMISELEFAETIPVLAGLASDHQGRIWVRRTAWRLLRPMLAPGRKIHAEWRYFGMHPVLSTLRGKAP